MWREDTSKDTKRFTGTRRHPNTQKIHQECNKFQVERPSICRQNNLQHSIICFLEVEHVDHKNCFVNPMFYQQLSNSVHLAGESL